MVVFLVVVALYFILLRVMLLETEELISSC